MENLVESFRERVKLAEAVYNKTHVTDAMPYSKKEVIAKVLDNTARLLKESMGGDSATQRGSLATNRKFALDITNVAYANCIATDLVLTKAMAGRSGLVSYIKFVTGTAKGEIETGTLINDPFQITGGNARIDYTGEKVVENHKATATEVTAHKFSFTCTWGPTEDGAVKTVVIGATRYTLVAAGSEVADVSCSATKTADGVYDIQFAAADTKFVADAIVKVGYIYNNAYIDAEKLPTIKAVRQEISVVAKPRRIAVEYSDLAAFEYKQETGADLGKALQTQAVAEMTYEIDCELVKMLADAAAEQGTINTFNETCPVGVGIKDHFAYLAKNIADCSNAIYKRTQKYVANYLVCGANVRTDLSVLDSFKAASNKQVAGPYFAGDLDGLKVYVSPNLDPDTYFVGFNGQELDTSAALFAPWMGLVPTQLLGFADGSMKQGWAIMYGTAMLNKMLVAEGKITRSTAAADASTQAVNNNQLA